MRWVLLPLATIAFVYTALNCVVLGVGRQIAIELTADHLFLSPMTSEKRIAWGDFERVDLEIVTYSDISSSRHQSIAPRRGTLNGRISANKILSSGIWKKNERLIKGAAKCQQAAVLYGGNINDDTLDAKGSGNQQPTSNQKQHERRGRGIIGSG